MTFGQKKTLTREDEFRQTAEYIKRISGLNIVASDGGDRLELYDPKTDSRTGITYSYGSKTALMVATDIKDFLELMIKNGRLNYPISLQ